MTVGSVSFAAPAAPLTDVMVYAVGSEQYGQYEYLDYDQIRTVEDHGGDPFYIVTADYGYSRQSSRIAKLNGIKLDYIGTEDIDTNGDSIVDVFLHYWDASGQTGGEFTYQATSENAPWNTYSDSIIIR
ncbi:DUF4879 domain-containing protein [Clostridium sp. D2Q-11]|uniref:DUF4879 domain-containing protein n=1 Tax=Anaeromonas frigoriresistens TaxID=2683708 RepID=A0A942UUX9_9FIRM|nr:DUF4879 domain-containing protein [Anaeromonas frigoriresistens]MBS4539568.1 DUF4879 domain-containing protein [Anaeromonas frigoriresistens]